MSWWTGSSAGSSASATPCPPPPAAPRPPPAPLAPPADPRGLRVPDVSVLTWQPLPPADDSWPTSGFGWRDDPIRHTRKFHSGAAIRAKSGTPVMAAGDGVVTFAGRQGGYGNVIYVDHGGGLITRY